MVIGVSRYGLSLLYKCYKLPGYGKKCPDRNTDKCFTCKYCKCEMPAFDATQLLNSFGRKEETHD